MYSTWGGMISLNSRPFYEGVRFRRSHQGNDSLKNECEASECSLLCQDFWKRGYFRIAVDPLIRVFYNTYDANNANEYANKFYERAKEHEKQWGSVSHIKWKDKPPKYVWCCPLYRKDSRHAQYDECGFRKIF